MTAIVTFTPNPAIDISTSVDRIEPIRKLRCAPQQRDPGGGGINVARVVQRLGGDVAAVYPVGGVTGQLLRRLVEREQVTSLTTAIDAETREDFAVTERATGQQYRFVLPGPSLAEADWRASLDLIAGMTPPPRFIVASGSLPPGVPDDFYARVGHVAKTLGAKFILDTSGPPLAAAVEAGVHLIKPNLRELGDLVGAEHVDQAAWEAASGRLVASGKVEVVALSLGHRGAALVTRDRILRAQPIPITPASAVGAGDSFLGAMVWSLAAGNDLEQSLRYAVAAGASALLNPGTALCRTDDVARLAAKVVITAA
jgi:6-phosphofructokinase 2